MTLLHKGRRTIVSIIIAVVLLLVGGAVFVAARASGGIQGLIMGSKPTPDPQSGTIQRQRQAVKRSLETSFNDLNKHVSFTDYATSTHDRCYKGQNNYKVRDGYAYKCTYRVTHFYGFGGNFREQMSSFAQKIQQVGWKAPADALTIQGVLKDYYDQYYGPDKPPTPNYPDGYKVSDLPQPDAYTKDDAILQIAYAQDDTPDIFSIEYAQQVRFDTLNPIYDQSDFQDFSVLYPAITHTNKFVLAVSLQEDYFRN